MAGSLKNIGLTSLDDLFKTDEQRQADAQERVQIVPADQVFPYARQPYSIDRPTQDLAQLMDSIERVGIAEPLIVRPRDGGGYEIIAGHRRDYCAKTIGLETRPVIVREYSDEDADILVVDYNIHRDDLLPSEKAKAYKLRLDAMKRKAGRPTKNSAQVGQNFEGRVSVEILSEQVQESRMQIQRYIRLNNLIPSLLEQVDSGTLKFVPAAESISYLTEKEQIYLAMVMERDEVSPSMDQAKRLKQLSAEGKLAENIIDLMHEKNGYYYIILNLTDSAGKRKPKWISTGLTIKGNKKRAEQMLMEERRKYTSTKAGDDVLFADFMEQWLEIVKSTVSVPTYSSYVNAVKSIIAPYFRKKKILLRDLQAHDIQMFYQEQLQRVKPASVIHYHANIHKALKYAVKNDMIPTNPADKVERPKQDKFYGSFYDKEELNKLFEAVAGTKLELPVLLGAFYGLRRSEIVGLKWSAVDFEQNTITINHTVTSCNLDGKCVIVAKDTTKTKSSRRTLPLVPYFHEKLLAVKSQQEKNQKLCGRSYNKEFLEYIW